MGKKNIQSGTEEFELFRDYWNLYKNNALVWDWRLYGLLFDTKGVLFGDNLSKCEKTKRFG